MNPDKLPLLVVSAACVLALGLAVLLRPKDEPLAPKPVERVPEFVQAGDPASPSAPLPSSSSGGERPVTFARNMPKGAGTPLVNGTGTYNLDVMKVAVPGPFGTMQYLPGSDQRAVEYLERVREQQENLVVDRGPTQADTGHIPHLGPLTGRATRSVKIGSPK